MTLIILTPRAWPKIKPGWRAHFWGAGWMIQWSWMCPDSRLTNLASTGWQRTAIITVAVFILGGGMIFSARKAPLRIGDKAPDFTLTDQNGGQVQLSDFRGKKNVVLAFYIKAFTSG